MNDRQHVSRQVIVKYLLHLQLIEMINDLSQNDDVCHTILPEQPLVG